MTQFFNRTQTVNVSRITPDGWWLENTQEHVTKGTALGSDFTQNIYTPSSEGMTARYDRESDTWSDEIEDMASKPYWNHSGQQFVIGLPDGDYPEWAIQQAPPKHDPQLQTVLHNEQTGWKVYDILIGTPFYDKWGAEFIVSDYNFELPDECTWQAPPEPEQGHAVELVDGEWQQLVDKRGEIAYAKDRSEHNDYQIEQLGELPNTHTLSEPQEFDSWQGDELGWTYDIERHRPVKTQQEKQWRNAALMDVINRIDQYERDQKYPVELRTSPIQNEQQLMPLLQDRKQLSDYPDTPDFPFGERPILSGQTN